MNARVQSTPIKDPDIVIVVISQSLSFEPSERRVGEGHVLAHRESSGEPMSKCSWDTLDSLITPLVGVLDLAASHIVA